MRERVVVVDDDDDDDSDCRLPPLGTIQARTEFCKLLLLSCCCCCRCFC